MDFAELANKDYLPLVTDDYSRYPVVEIVKSTSASAVIPKLDKVFSEFEIPATVRPDNGPPFNGKEFALFAEDWFQTPKDNPQMAKSGREERFYVNSRSRKWSSGDTKLVIL